MITKTGTATRCTVHLPKTTEEAEEGTRRAPPQPGIFTVFTVKRMSFTQWSQILAQEKGEGIVGEIPAAESLVLKNIMTPEAPQVVTQRMEIRTTSPTVREVLIAVSESFTTATSTLPASGMTEDTIITTDTVALITVVLVAEILAVRELLSMLLTTLIGEAPPTLQVLPKVTKVEIPLVSHLLGG